MDDGGRTDERITYLIANHDLGPYIGDCLESLRRQTDPRWLALVVDDASTDRSPEVIAPFIDERIHLCVNDRHVGYIATLKRLVAEAATDIVAILDADDAIAPGATARLLKAYAADPRTEFVYSRFATYDETFASLLRVDGSAIPDRGTALCDGVVGAIRSFRRGAYHRTAGLDDAMLYAEDRDLVYKLEEVTRPVFIDEVLYHYRRRSGSQSCDPEKREIGAISTRRARSAALRRRQVSGPLTACYEVFFWADYVAGSRAHTHAVRRLGHWLERAAGFLCRRFDARLERGRPSTAARR